MPKGPQGQKRPGDVFGNVVHIAKIASSEIKEATPRQPAKRMSGLAGGKAHQHDVPHVQRSDIARKAANARWK